MAKSKKPNILVIWGDDIGITNLSCYSDGLMGYRTPNIDRIANEGMRFTDSYGQQSCTAGRSAFLTGQNPFRTGLTKVGLPGADAGLQAEDPTIAELLKPLGYVTGQFGKNHFGDLNKYLPTVHGFDEFLGNLYHLNAEEEPEHVDYPPEKDFPEFKKMFGPRGVIHSWATENDDPTEEPRWGRVGRQKIEDTGPLNKKRMETCDLEIPAGSVSNEVISHTDWLPTLLAAAGEPAIVDKLKKGHHADEKHFKVHIDGYNFLPHFTGQEAKGPRPGLIYFSDDGDLIGLRYDNWKVVFAEQRATGTVQIWMEPFTFLRIPKLFNLRTDPYERADITSNTYFDWFIDRFYLMYAAQYIVREFMATFKDFPPRMKAASFTIDQVLEKMLESHRD